MENNQINKDKFIAQYFGQEVGKIIDSDRLWSVGRFRMSDYDYLSLKPLSEITDEDAKEVGYRIVGGKDRNYKNDIFCKEDGFAWAKRGGMKPVMDVFESSSAIDYLRSKGYALPYNGLSVEKQIEYGWIKIA